MRVSNFQDHNQEAKQGFILEAALVLVSIIIGALGTFFYFSWRGRDTSVPFSPSAKALKWAEDLLASFKGDKCLKVLSLAMALTPFKTKPKISEVDGDEVWDVPPVSASEGRDLLETLDIEVLDSYEENWDDLCEEAEEDPEKIKEKLERTIAKLESAISNAKKDDGPDKAEALKAFQTAIGKAVEAEARERNSLKEGVKNLEGKLGSLAKSIEQLFKAAPKKPAKKHATA